MANAKITPIKSLKGTLRLKGDKSISHRAVMIGSIAKGRTVIKNFLNSSDCLCTMEAFRQLGIRVDFSGDELSIEGKGLHGLKKPKDKIYLGNSGTSMRLISGILAGQNFETVLTGDESLTERPMYRIIEPLRLMGADIKAREDKLAPLTIKGSNLKPIKYRTKVASAQVKSAVMLAGLYADGVTEITEPAKSRDHTERMLGLFGAKLVIDGLKVLVHGNPSLRGISITIPGDISGAAFFITAALLLKDSEIIIKDVLFNRTRMGFLEALKEMNADISIENTRFNGCEETCDIIARSSELKGIKIKKDRMPALIDELPILMVAAAMAKGKTDIKGAGELRIKETDRITSMTEGLKAMGAKVLVNGNDLSIEGEALLKGTGLKSLGDHRTAMSLAVAALLAKGASNIEDIDCVETSFPDFFKLLDSVSVKSS